MNTSILIVDPERLVREGLRQILEAQAGFHVVGEAAGGAEAVERVAETKVDVAIVEGQMQRAGVAAVAEIRAASEHTACVILARLYGPLQVQQALSTGAAGFVPKDSPASELIAAVRAVSQGRSYLAPAIADQVVNVLRSPSGRGPTAGEQLTSRQRQVLGLVAQGLTTKEVAAELGISVKTAQTHRAKVMSRVGVRKASALVRYAVREGFVSA